MSFIQQSFIKQWHLERGNEAGVDRIGVMWKRSCQGHHMAHFTLLSPVIWPSARSRYSHIMLQGITAVSSRNGVKIGWVIVFPLCNSAWAVFLQSISGKQHICCNMLRFCLCTLTQPNSYTSTEIWKRGLCKRTCVMTGNIHIINSYADKKW